MAAKSVKKTSKKQPESTANLSNFYSFFSLRESYTSLLLGLIAVIILSLFIVSFIRSHNYAGNHIQQISSTHTGPSQSGTPTVVKTSPKVYTIASGDSLWNIAQNQYNDAYKWVDIAKANNLANPNLIFAGDKLVIPQTKVITAQTVSSKTGMNAVPQSPGSNYIVVKGDSLWSISVSKYGNGYRWTQIAQINNLTNPNLIFSGNVLSLPQ